MDDKIKKKEINHNGVSIKVSNNKEKNIIKDLLGIKEHSREIPIEKLDKETIE